MAEELTPLSTSDGLLPPEETSSDEAVPLDSSLFGGESKRDTAKTAASNINKTATVILIVRELFRLLKI
jgi:hypothetical protein